MASTPTSAQGSASIGTFGRLTGVLFSPKETFPDIVQTPSWVAPLALICLISIAVIAIFGQRVGWRGFMEKQFEKNSRVQSMTPEQREEALNRAVKFAPIEGHVFGVGGTIIGALVVASIFLGMFNGFAGAELKYKTSLGIVTHAWMPFVIHGLLGIMVLFLKDPSTVDIQNLVASNLGAVLSSDSPHWLSSLATSFDFFTFWVLFLLAVGYSSSNPKKISVGKAFTYVALPWAVFVLLKVGLATVFS